MSTEDDLSRVLRIAHMWLAVARDSQRLAQDQAAVFHEAVARLEAERAGMEDLTARLQAHVDQIEAAQERGFPASIEVEQGAEMARDLREAKEAVSAMRVDVETAIGQLRNTLAVADDADEMLAQLIDED